MKSNWPCLGRFLFLGSILFLNFKFVFEFRVYLWVKVYQEDIIPMTVNIQSINCVSNNLKLFGHRLYGLLQKKNVYFAQNPCIDDTMKWKTKAIWIKKII